MLIGTEILDTKARDRLKLFLSENLDIIDGEILKESSGTISV